MSAHLFILHCFDETSKNFMMPILQLSNKCLPWLSPCQFNRTFKCPAQILSRTKIKNHKTTGLWVIPLISPYSHISGASLNENLSRETLMINQQTVVIAWSGIYFFLLYFSVKCRREVSPCETQTDEPIYNLCPYVKKTNHRSWNERRYIYWISLKNHWKLWPKSDY